ncbi:MAG: hypothetical protein ACFFB5_16475 [Promethearchaeota archaeon]
MVLFQQGLQNSIKVMPNLEPTGLCACLKMARYCLKVSPGFLPRNKYDKIALIKTSNMIFQLIFPLKLPKGEFLPDDSYSDARYLSAQADPFFLPNIKFKFLKNNPTFSSNSISISAIFPLSSPLEELIERTLDFFNQNQ